MDIVSLVCSVILCGIGIATFVGGMTSRSKSDGVLMQKLDQAIDGIEELKTDMKIVKDNQHASDLKIQHHEDQIKTLFKLFDNNEHTNQALISIMGVLNQILTGGNYHHDP